MSEAPRHELAYAPRPSGTRRVLRRVWRWWPRVFVLLALAAAIHQAPRAYRQWQLLRAQQACMGAVIGGEGPVFEADTVRGAELLARGPTVYRRINGTGPVAVTADARWDALATMLGVPVELPGQSAGSATVRPATVFLHERRTPSGKARLVVVELDEEMLSDLYVTVIEPASGMSPARVLRREAIGQDVKLAMSYMRPGRNPRMPHDSRVWSGRALPLDPTRFTVAIRARGEVGVLDFQMRDDDGVVVWLQDRVQFIVKSDSALLDNRMKDMKWESAEWMRELVVRAHARSATDGAEEGVAERDRAVAEWRDFVDPPERPVEERRARAITGLRSEDRAARAAAARELLRLAAAAEDPDREALAALVRAVESGDMAAREGLTLAVERAAVRRVSVNAILDEADEERDGTARTFLRAGRRAAGMSR
ncbi:MAG: hypothetical protein ACAI43_15650 [Phycisphaerae bacterium]